MISLLSPESMCTPSETHTPCVEVPSPSSAAAVLTPLFLPILMRRCSETSSVGAQHGVDDNGSTTRSEIGFDANC